MKEELKRWMDLQTKMHAEIERWLAFGLNVNNPMFDSMWNLCQHHTELMAHKLNVSYEVLEWFSTENGFGEAELQASNKKDGELRTISTLDDLIWLIDAPKD